MNLDLNDNLKQLREIAPAIMFAAFVAVGAVLLLKFPNYYFSIVATVSLLGAIVIATYCTFYWRKPRKERFHIPSRRDTKSRVIGNEY